MNGLIPVPLDDDAMPGITYDWAIQICLDLTDQIADLFWDGLVTGPTPATITVGAVGAQVVSTVSVSIPKETTATWLPGVYPYRCVVHISNGGSGEADIAAYGCLLVRTPRPVS